MPISVRIPSDAPAGPTIARIDVVAQPCDDTRCLAPATLRVEVPIVVTVAPVARTEH